MRRPRRGRKAKGSRNFSISATNVEWVEAGAKAARLGLSRARYVKRLVERDLSGGETAFTALAPEEQRELLETVREIRALLREDPADDREPARSAPARPKPKKVGPAKSSDPAEPGEAASPQPRLL